MADRTGDPMFSVKLRREMAGEREAARRVSLASAKEALARLAYERRLARLQLDLARAEREACGKAGRQPLGNRLAALVEAIRQQLRRWVGQDGPELVVAGDKVAQVVRRSGGAEGTPLDPQPPPGPPKHGVNGNPPGGRWG